MNDDKINNIINGIFLTVIVIICVSAIVGAAQAWILYGDKPLSEVPMWALWFMVSHK